MNDPGKSLKGLSLAVCPQQLATASGYSNDVHGLVLPGDVCSVPGMGAHDPEGGPVSDGEAAVIATVPYTKVVSRLHEALRIGPSDRVLGVTPLGSSWALRMCFQALLDWVLALRRVERALVRLRLGTPPASRLSRRLGNGWRSNSGLATLAAAPLQRAASGSLPARFWFGVCFSAGGRAPLPACSLGPYSVRRLVAGGGRRHSPSSGLL